MIDEAFLCSRAGKAGRLQLTRADGTW